jgi:hypothetical protein
MKAIMKSIFSAKGELSFKRISSGITLLVLLVLSFINTYTEHKTPEYVFDWLVMIVIAGYGGTVAEEIFKKKTNDTPTEEGTTP